jgi:putative UDP-glucose 4-epimerase
MSLLITGGTGYIGKKLVQQLRKKNSNVYSIGIEDLNLLNYGDTLNFLKENNIKKIIHLGWSMNNENSAIYDNIEAMSNLIKSCEEVQIEKFIFASTNNVYGTKIKNVPFLEEDRLSPDINNKYGVSKYIGEKLAMYTLEKKCCIIRIADVYGPGQNHGNLIKAIISNVENKENIKLYGKGERERDYIYIDDVIRGIEFIYENNLSGIYNLGTGEGTSVKKIVDIVLNLCQNRIGLDYIEAENEDTSKVVLNVEKLKKLGFNYSINIKEGLKKIIEERGMSDGKF